MIFQPEHAADISSVYLLNQIFESVSDLFVKEISNRTGPLTIELFVCVSFCSIDIKIAHCCFLFFSFFFFHFLFVCLSVLI